MPEEAQESADAVVAAGSGDEGGGTGTVQLGAQPAPKPDPNEKIEESISRLEGTIKDALSKVSTQEREEPYFEEDYDDDDGVYEEEGYEDEEELPPGADLDPEQVLRQAVQQELAPHLQAQAEEKRQEGIVALEEQYPELAEDEYAEGVFRSALAVASELGEPELARQPAFLERVYLSMKAEERLNQESETQDESEVTVEGGGGGNPGEAETDLADLVVSAGKSRGIFS